MSLTITQKGTEFARFFNAVRYDPFLFAKAFRFTPTPQQAELFNDAKQLAIHGQPTHMAAKSGQGPGKTTAASLLGLWRAFRSAKALTVATAPTMRQCKDVWLGEARKHIENAFPEVRRWFDVRATDIEILGVKNWGIKLVSASRQENLAGWHNPHLTFIIDEASGVPRQLIETVLGTMTNPDQMVLMISNPTKRDSYFFDAFNKDRNSWSLHTFNAEESPIVDQRNVQRLLETYGRESDVYRVRVLGEFPLSDPNCVMSSDDVEACMAPGGMFAAAARTVPGLVSRQFGMDFARFGNDRSVIYRRSGLAIVEQAKFSKTEPDVVVARAFDMARQASWGKKDCWYVPDAGGMGQGVMHHFHNTGRQVVEFHNGGRAYASAEYDDKITEAFFSLAGLVKKRLVYLPKDQDLLYELSTRQYAMTLKNKIKVDSKDDWRAEEQRASPDHADAAVMAYYPHTGAASRVLT